MGSEMCIRDSVKTGLDTDRSSTEDYRRAQHRFEEYRRDSKRADTTQRSQGSHGMATATATAEHADTAGPMEGTTGPQGTEQADAAGPTKGRRQHGPQRAEASRAHRGQKAEDSRGIEQVHVEDAQRRMDAGSTALSPKDFELVRV